MIPVKSWFCCLVLFFVSCLVLQHLTIYKRALWRFRLKDLSIDEMVGTWSFGCCQAHWGLPVGFLLLQYSVLFTVESLSLLYLLFISWFICSRRWCIDALRWCFVCGPFVLFLSCFVMLSCTSVCWCRVVICWERADLLALFCDV